MVATRRSRSNNSGDDESVTSSNTADQREREPLLPSISEQSARRPPPPPPPPLMPTAVAGNSPRPTLNTPRLLPGQGVEVPNPAGENVNVSRDELPVQYLQVRATTSSYHPSKIYRRHHHSQQSNDSKRLHKRKQSSSMNTALSQSVKGEVIRVLIPANGFASEKQLSDCLNHACNADGIGMNSSIQNFPDDASWDSTEEFYEDKRRNNVAGMFRESDGVFVPLSVIYSQPRAFVDDILSIKLPTRKKTQQQHKESAKKSSIFITFLEIFGIVSVTFASWLTYSVSQSVDWGMATNKMESLFLAMVNLPFYLFDVIIEFPLRELYRHGPSLIGWEGESLARICSRVTHYGDEDFWRRNMEECEGIYASKEAAAMQIRKPILIGAIVLIMFYMVKSIVEAQAMRRQQLDPNMVETYRAITMLARQLKRAVNNNR